MDDEIKRKITNKTRISQIIRAKKVRWLNRIFRIPGNRHAWNVLIENGAERKRRRSRRTGWRWQRSILGIKLSSAGLE